MAIDRIGVCGTALDEAAVQAFQAQLRGRLLQAGDADYDTARCVWNAMIDRRPALIAQCVSAADVMAAVRFAREHGLLVSIRGGGHSVAGTAVCDDGLLLDLSGMKGIRVDLVAGTARAEPGLTWGEFDRETQAFGLATTGGTVSTTGIAGLTLGGGVGWLMSQYGATVDNLLSVDLVTADGCLLTASASQHEDLFWAVRGGGGNFGVVTSFEYWLHPVGPIILGGMVLHPLERANEVLRFYREFTRAIPDELTVYAGLLTSPEGAPVVALALCYAGPIEAGERIVEPLRAFGTPIADMIGPIPYTVQNSLMDAAVPPGLQYYWKSTFLRALSDDAIDTVVDRFRKTPSPRNIVMIEHEHGAINRVSPEATAFPHRTSPFDLVLFASWESQTEAEANISWTRATLAAMQPFASDGVYVNALDRDEADRVATAYGPNYARLAAIKAKYDPTNFFRGNHNITPSG